MIAVVLQAALANPRNVPVVDSDSRYNFGYDIVSSEDDVLTRHTQTLIDRTPLAIIDYVK